MCVGILATVRTNYASNYFCVCDAFLVQKLIDTRQKCTQVTRSNIAKFNVMPIFTLAAFDFMYMYNHNSTF